MTSPHRAARRAGFLVALLMPIGLVAAACGGDETAVPDTTGPAPATPVAIAGVHHDVEFYPACGNETLLHEGVTWYPLARAGFVATDPSFEQTAAEIAAVERDAPPSEARHGLIRVAPPGPGDDTGTLVVWADGVANWTSASGDLEVWMIDDGLTYAWVC